MPSRDKQRYRMTYSYYRVQPRLEVQYIVDEALDWKNSVRAASTANVPLAGSNPLTIDGVTISGGNRVLLKSQSTTSQNGIYTMSVNESGTNYTLSRTTDATTGTLSCGAATYVEEGSTNGAKIYILSTTDPITVGSTSLTWTLFAGGGGGGSSSPEYWSSTTNSAIYTTGSVAIKGNLAGVDAPTDIGSDVFFFVSGSITGSGVNDKKSLFGGDVVMSGSLRVTNGISGSLTKLTDGTSYLIAGPNITINTGSNGSVQITGSAGGGITGSGTDGYLTRWTGTSTLGDSHIYYWTGAPSITTYRYKAYHNQFVSLNDTVQLVLETNNTTGARVGINSSGPAYSLAVSEGVTGTSTIASFRNTDASGGTDRGIQMYMGAGNFNPGTFQLLHEWKTDRHYTRFRTTNLSSLAPPTSGPIEDLLVLSSDRKVLVTGSLSVRYDGSSQVGTVVDVQKLDGNQIMWISSSAGTNPVGTDVFMWVSGSRTDNNTGANKVVFGGDVRVSGSLTIGTGSVFITSNDIQFGTSTMRIQKNGNDMKFFDITNPSGYTLTELAAGGGGGGLGGSGTTNYVAKFTGTSTLGISTIFDNGTNVGIGTSSMSKKLVVHGGDALVNGATFGKGNGSGSDNFAGGVQALDANSGGFGNTAVGYQSLKATTGGYGNTSIGAYSMITNTDGNANTSVGYNNLNANTTGVSNTAVGYSSLASNTTGIHNTAVGESSLNANATGNYNVAVGTGALYSSNGSNNNTAVGSYSLSGNGTGADNTAVGFRSMTSNSTGRRNAALGYYSLYTNSTGEQNTAVGYNSLYANTAGSNNTAVGYNSLDSNTTGGNNVAIGNSALQANSTGNNSVAIGNSSLYFNTVGGNTAVGSFSLYTNTTGYNNTAIGSGSMYSNSTGWGNTAVGSRTLYSNTYGQDNTAIGAAAMESNGIGYQNVAIGSGSMSLGSGGPNHDLIAIGYQAMMTQQGTHNIAIGTQAMLSGSDGDGNIMIGSYSGLNLNGKSYSNIGIGISSLSKITTQDYNVAVGGLTLQYLDSGATANVAIGYGTLNGLTTGNVNVGLGPAAGAYVTSGTGNVFIGGYSAQYTSFTTQDNNIFLSDGSGNLRMMVTGSYGYVGVGTNEPAAMVDILGGGVPGDTPFKPSIRVRGGASSGYGYIQFGNGSAFQNWHIGSEGNGDFRFYNENFGSGVLKVTFNDYGEAYKGNNQTTWEVTSDERLKKNITPIQASPLGFLLKLRGVEYEWKDQVQSQFPNKTGKQIGFIAQDVEKVFSSWVGGSKARSSEIEQLVGDDKVKSLSFGTEFFALTVESLRELKNENDSLKTENANLALRLAAVEEALKKIGV